ncbi:MAG: hypothetical protein SOZ34_04760 [Clostridia bacterium]|nr:hypothetical protein [Clostridia bacterium]
MKNNLIKYEKDYFIKKCFIGVLTIVIAVLFPVFAFAGSVPEDLLYTDYAEVYFGEVKSVEGDRITVIQRKNIKGAFEEGRTIEYQKFAFTKNPKVGEIYLCGYFDENNPLDIWQVTSLDTASLKILNDDDMSKRMQKYLNDGLFDEQNAKLAENDENKSEIEKSDNEDTASFNFKPTVFFSLRCNTVEIIVTIVILLIVVITVIYLIKRKRK